jgi:hypothetical protein
MNTFLTGFLFGCAAGWLVAKIHSSWIGDEMEHNLSMSCLENMRLRQELAAARACAQADQQLRKRAEHRLHFGHARHEEN